MMCFTLYILWNVWNDMLNQSKQQAKLLDPLTSYPHQYYSAGPRGTLFFFFLLGRHAINKRRLFHPDSDRFCFFFSLHIWDI